MKRAKCNSCGFVSFPNDTFCKKCKKRLTFEAQNPTTPDQPQTLGNLEFQSKISLMAIIVLIIGGSFTLFTIYVCFFYQEVFDGYADDLKLFVLMFGIVPFLCCLGVFKLFYDRKIKIYQNGFVCQRGKKKATVFWREITNFHVAIEWWFIDFIPIGRGKTITLKTCFDEEYVLGQEISGLSKIQNHIIESVSKYA
jgi:hypothetical protein